jgi:uncharacterized integral membrane protein
VKILRSIVRILLIVVGVMVSIPNMTPVRFVYLPVIPLVSSGEAASVEIPLALLLLAFLALGALFVGTSTLVEHVRLRFLVRRNAKVVKGLRADLDRSRAALEQAEASLSTRSSELAGETARANKAEEGEAKALALAEQERGRADEAQRLALPSGN